jgi:deoxyadenosine/deoxycytidine kinase
MLFTDANVSLIVLVVLMVSVMGFIVTRVMFFTKKAVIKIISFEGGIGAGKSTILSQIKEYINKKKIDNIFIIKEPVDLWERTGILSKFYSDQNKYSGFFQLFVLETLIDILRNKINECLRKKNHKTIYIITERSIESTKWVFAQMLYDDKIITEEEMKCYIYVYGMLENKKYSPNAIIYLNTPPLVCKERIINRNRDGENNIEYNYLEKCEYYYKKMVNFYRESKKVLEIEYNKCDNNFNGKDNICKDNICKDIIDFIKST